MFDLRRSPQVGKMNDPQNPIIKMGKLNESLFWDDHFVITVHSLDAADWHMAVGQNSTCRALTIHAFLCSTNILPFIPPPYTVIYLVVVWYYKTSLSLFPP